VLIDVDLKKSMLKHTNLVLVVASN